MLALVKTKKGVGNLELKEVPMPVYDADEVLIEVKAAGICGTDIHVKHDNFPYWPPVILGHEFSGVIVEVGKDVKNFKEGDRVVGEPHTQACGKCYLCRTGNIQICPEKRSPGWGIDGAFAKFLKMPEKLLHRLPDDVSFEEGAVVEPTCNVVHDVLERGRVEPNDFVVVLGPGPIGLLASMAAKAGGARGVMIIGTPADEELRLAKAREIGIDHVVNLGETDPVEKCLDLTHGIGADLIVEASGAEPAINSAVELVRKKGRITAIGIPAADRTNFAWRGAMFKVCDIIFNLSTSYTSWDKAIGLIASGRINAKAVITHREPLENWEQVFDDLENLHGLKGILIP
ncbi:MAG: alcohol dehydrogenase catalytic domain-containing protein [Planctomycetes bacterium]|nr:alcohol dehydrogenase catalytic domain-containing protein [Planctomycetota bacterium]